MHVLLVLMWLAMMSPVGLAGSAASDTFHQAFNAAARQAGVSLSLAPLDCDRHRRCNYAAGPAIRAVASGGDDLDEVAFYVPAGLDAAGRRRAAMEATRIVSVLIRQFDDRPAAAQGEVLKDLLDQATGPSRRGEARLSRGVIVLSATQADNFRVYVTR